MARKIFNCMLKHYEENRQNADSAVESERSRERERERERARERASERERERVVFTVLISQTLSTHVHKKISLRIWNVSF